MTGWIYLKEAVRMLWSAKQRTLLALLGIVIGISSVIAMVSIGHIASEESLKQFRSMGIDLMSVTPDENSASGEPISPPTATRADKLHVGLLRYLPGQVTDILAMTPVARNYQQGHFAGKNGNIEMIGVNAELVRLNQLQLLAGRFIGPFDESRNVVVLGQNALKDLHLPTPTAQWLGKRIELGGAVFEIIGLLEPARNLNAVLGFNVNDTAIMTVPTMMRAFGANDLHSLAIRLQGEQFGLSVQRQISQYFAKVAPSVRLNFRTAKEMIEQMQAQAEMFTLLLGSIASISMVVGGVGIMNIMLVSVSERRKEIGIRRALGAKRRDIQVQFLVEAILLSLVGGVFGIAVGIGCSWWVAILNHWNFTVSLFAVWSGFGMAVAVGLLFGYFPARQAAYTDPIKALQSV